VCVCESKGIEYPFFFVGFAFFLFWLVGGWIRSDRRQTGRVQTVTPNPRFADRRESTWKGRPSITIDRNMYDVVLYHTILILAHNDEELVNDCRLAVCVLPY
jgi:hypothetical protein